MLLDDDKGNFVINVIISLDKRYIVMLAAGFWHEIACQNDGRVRDTKMICQKIEGLYHSLFYSLF